jgi:hypothetical protein
MEFLREWFFGVAGAAVAGAFALAITPQGASQRAVRIAAALALCVAVLRPFTGALTLPDLTAGLPRSEEGQPGQGISYDVLSSIIAEKTAAYIVSKAQALGLDVTAAVRCKQVDEWPVPWAVTISHPRPEHAKSALSKMIEQDLGIPPERQTYKEATS